VSYLPRKGWGRGKLYRSLQSEDPGIRVEALRLLGIQGKVDLERIYPLLSDKDDGVRQAACILIGTIAMHEAVPHLVTTMAKDSNPQVCRYAAWALRQIPDEQRLVQLVSVFIHGKNKKVIRIAAMGLRQYRYLPVVEDIVRGFTTGGNLTWRNVDHVAIENLALLGFYTVEPLMSYLQSNDLRVQVNTALALGRIGDGRAAPALASTLRNVVQEARPSIGVALVELADDAVEPVAELLDDNDKEVRLTAAQVLGNIGEPAVSTLLESLRRRDSKNIEEVIYALGLTHSPESFYPLLKTCEMSKEDKAKAWATIALAISCAHNYRQVEEKKDIIRALDIVKDSLAPHVLLDSETLLELGKAFLYCNRFIDEKSNAFTENLERALTCFAISQENAPCPRAALYFTFIDAYLRALHATSPDVVEFQEASIRRELEASEYPLDDQSFNNYIRVLLSLFGELRDVKNQPIMQHYEAYIMTLGLAESDVVEAQTISGEAAGILYAPQRETGDRVAYIMSDLIDDLMGRLEKNPEPVHLMQQVSLEILSMKVLEISKYGMPQVSVVLEEIVHVLPRRMSAGTKTAIAVSVVVAAAVAAFLAIELLGYIDLLPWF